MVAVGPVVIGAEHHGEEVMLNWIELRTLVIGAEQYGRQQDNKSFIQVMNSISNQLRKVWLPPTYR